MEPTPLPFDSPLVRYDEQAVALLSAFRAGDAGALACFRRRLPRFLQEKIPWLPRDMTDAEVAATPLELADARLALARRYDFRDWAALEAHVTEVIQPGSPVHRFEAAVDTVVSGDLSTLRELLAADPELVRARSRRITHFDPPVHRAMLLHYVAANGVEGYRQKTPPNAVEILQTLLSAGAEPDALANLYGGECTTLSLLVSSCHPAKAGLQAVLAETLMDGGASLKDTGSGRWVSPLLTALIFGYVDTAEALVRRGALMDTLTLAAGMGRLEDARRLLPGADAAERHRAFALAALLGRTEIVRLMLDAGEDPDRFNPDGYHSGATPLHHAAHNGHRGVVELLVARGGRLDIRDTSFHGTPVGWAEHGGHQEIAELLRAAQSKQNPKDS